MGVSIKIPSIYLVQWEGDGFISLKQNLQIVTKTMSPKSGLVHQLRNI